MRGRKDNRKLGQATLIDRLSQGQGHIYGRRRQQHFIVYEFAWWFHDCHYSFRNMDNFRSVIKL